MGMIEISLETPQLGGRRSQGGLQFTTAALEANLRLSDQATQEAIVSAIREASLEAREIAVQQLSSRLNCDRRLIEARVKSEEVSVAKARGTIRIMQNRIDLKHFRTEQTAKGVTVKTGSGRDRFYRGAFGPNIKRLGGNVFRRQTKDRLPIKKARGVSLVRVANESGISELVRIQFQYRARIKIKSNLVRVAFGIFRSAA